MQAQMIQCGLASGYKVWYLATEGKEWRDRFAKLLHQLDSAAGTFYNRASRAHATSVATEMLTLERLNRIRIRGPAAGQAAVP
jgi:hypothetical protein